MKYQEGFIGKKADLADFIKKVIPDLFANKYVVEGKTVSIPKDWDLDYKVKFDEAEDGGSFTIKVSWDNTVEVEAEEED